MESSSSNLKSRPSPDDPRFHVVNKPRTNYSNTILRRTQPHVDIAKKIQSITMSKLKVLTFMHLKKEEEGAMRKVRTEDTIPKIFTIISNSPKRNKRKESFSKTN